MEYRPRWKDALVVLAVALAFRVAYLLEASRFPDWNLFYMDQEYHLEWARALATGVWRAPYDMLRHAPFFRAPLYPYFLAGLFKLVGANTTAVRAVQALIGSVSCSLVYAVGTRCFGRRAGLAAGIVAALYWVLAYFDGELLLPVFLVFFVLLGFLLAFRAADRGSPLVAGASGLVLGLYSITRPNILIFMPFAVWWIASVSLKRGRRAAAVMAVAMAIGCLAPPAAVTVRNAIVGGDAAPVASQGGVNLYIGNNPESNGLEAVVPGTRQTWWGGYEDAVGIAERDLGRELRPTEVSSYWFGRAVSYVRGDPAGWLRLTLRKTLALVGDPEPPNNEPYEARRDRYWTLRSVPLSFSTLLALFVVALPLSLLRWGKRLRPPLGIDDDARRRLQLVLIFLVVYSLSVIAFFVTGRYRVPLVPFLAMGTGASLVGIWDLVVLKRWKVAAAFVIAACAVAVPLRFDYLHVRSSTTGFAVFSDATDLLEAGDFDGALAALEAVRASGATQGPEFYHAVMRAYVGRADPSDAPAMESAVTEGLARYPDDPELLWYGMVGRFGEGRLPEAWDLARRYIAARPDDIRGYYMSVGIAVARGDTAEARSLLDDARKVDASSPLVERMERQLGVVPGG